MLTGVQIIDSVYCGLWVCVILAFLVGEWGNLLGQEGVGAAIWILLFFGCPWWGSAACALSGSGLSMCGCCSPTTSLKLGFTLCLIGGIIPLLITLLGFVTTGARIGEATLEGDASAAWNIFYFFWVPGSIIIGLVRIVLPSVACCGAGVLSPPFCGRRRRRRHSRFALEYRLTCACRNVFDAYQEVPKSVRSAAKFGSRSNQYRP
eukprot:COSAG02_NODE_7080_length_3194_cov_3.346189_4_plen_206_part_00